MKPAYVAVIVSAFCTVLLAQTDLPRFEVASVRVNKSDRGGGSGFNGLPGERLTIVNMTLRSILLAAYGMPSNQIVGGPGWVEADRFDIAAKAEKPVSADQLRLMLRSLLAERFKLAVHIEKRATPVYALVLARQDGKLGPNLRQAAGTCEPARDPEQCGMKTYASALVTGQMAVRGLDLSTLRILERDAGRPIVDRTGLTGAFDWELTWTLQPRLLTPVNSITVDPNGPSVFTALQEQLGLKLDSQQEAREFLVIDHVEQPTEN
jgi:uncharacterized protein (TIGR03435 family)